MKDINSVTVVALGTGTDFIKTFENLKEYLIEAEDVTIKNVYMEELTLSEALKSHDETLNWDLFFRFSSFHDAALTIERLTHEIPDRFVRVAVITRKGYLSISDVHGDGLLDDYLSHKTSEEIIRKIVKSLELNSSL